MISQPASQPASPAQPGPGSGSGTIPPATTTPRTIVTLIRQPSAPPLLARTLSPKARARRAEGFREDLDSSVKSRKVERVRSSPSNEPMRGGVGMEIVG
ncbi:MAG: hypothetical protein JWM76_2138 [Pseudonocardiales bacterium]|nr:hypothetical protein [Pseudonocardiales bacterium]